LPLTKDNEYIQTHYKVIKPTSMNKKHGAQLRRSKENGNYEQHR